MKKITVLILLCLGFYNLTAQGIQKSVNSVQVGLNGAFFGSGDLIGPCFYGEYNHTLNDYLSVAPRIFGGFASKYDEYESFENYNQLTSFGVNLSLRITPLPKMLNRFKIDVGPLFHKMVNSYGSISENMHYTPYVYYDNENLFGISGSLMYEFYRTEKTATGLRFDMLTSFTEGYYNCDSFQLGVFWKIGL